MKKNILVVDDDERNMRLFSDLLEVKGYAVIKARNGKEGVELAEKAKPDLILMDIQMPIMDGMEAINILKNRESTKSIPIIALTSYAMPDEKERILSTGCNGYLAKPVVIREFLNMVAEHVISTSSRGE